MLKKLKVKLQTQIFIWYSIVVLAVVAVMSVASAGYISHILLEREKQNTSSLSSLISDQLDMLYLEMEKMSGVVIYNRDVTALLDSIYDSLPARDEASQLQRTRDIRSLVYALVSMNGPSPSVHSINIINPEKKFFAGIFAQTSPTGNVTATLPEEIREEIRKADGNCVILPPHNDYWILGKSIMVLSVIREKRDIYGRSYGLVEVQQQCGKFEEICTPQQADKPIDVLVFDSRRHPIYPFEPDGEGNEQLRQSLCDAPSSGLTIGKNFYSVSRSQVTGFYTVVRTPRDELMRSADQVRRSFLLMGILLIAASFLLVFLLSKTISAPLRQLCAAVDSVNFSPGSKPAPFLLSSGSMETMQLNRAFENMLLRLNASADELARTRTSELESSLYALQAQINPHFIHNVLANVGAIADEHDIGEISGICYMLSRILRYSLSDVRAHTEMSTEFENTRTYFKLLQFRYGRRLEYAIDLDPRLRRVPIPKLLLQPLVENAVLYGKSTDGDCWRIAVTAILEGNTWRISIEDSGTGFSTEALVKVQRLLDRLENDHPFSPAEIQHGIGGMGIANVAFRLKLFFHHEVRLAVANLPGKGACVSITGKMPELTPENSAPSGRAQGESRTAAQ